ncbi:uncharacterized protein BJ171DRAFT_623875 [Polychytrium aggregatum]|uniref:uncharacterized protein n=1 Tax=Polychytrium aggregatum TaxID=110093 RepID=UPI0022FE7715|nr:uncharacterized protein BJ171DRAFT_623875 [Polychytrium aggregatum]KAI9203537.1 hypothetical protein BJ171DRAFT_623875 [Polychytrium aggregatum]
MSRPTHSAYRASTGVTSTSAVSPPGTTSINPNLGFYQIPEGRYTYTIYSYIRDGRYADVIKILGNEMQTFSKSRAALSLMGWCYYMNGDFGEAANCYEQLVRYHPEVDDYRLYYAQSLLKSGQYAASLKACQMIENPELGEKILKLQASVKYETNDLAGCKQLVDQCPPDDPDTMINQACLLFKETKYEEACLKYSDASKILGYQAELSYNIALCHYQLKQYVPALKYIADIIEKGIRDHPDDAAREALTDMPPRLEQELDPVTLQNQALINMDEDPTTGFEKLNFLLQQVSCPPETFGNLLLLYIKYEYYDLAADLLAENQGMPFANLNSYLFEYLDATLLRQSSPEEAYKKFDDLANKHVDVLRKLTKQVSEARQNHDDETVKRAVNEYEDGVERYIPVLMAQAKIYWDLENYSMVEKIFRKSVEFCNEHDVWKLNVAHVLFMQENKYKEAISFYEPIVKKHYENILEVTAIVLANLCVSYIMTSQNEEAEELMRKIEREEERVAYEDPNKRTYHLCIVNLVIGTLYCAKGNYEFGISRIMKSLEPFNKKLGTDTWYYAKRCFASLFETLAKHMIILKDSVFQEALAFFDACELHGRQIPVVIDPVGVENIDPAKNSVSYEARLFKSLFLRLYQ